MATSSCRMRATDSLFHKDFEELYSTVHMEALKATQQYECRKIDEYIYNVILAVMELFRIILITLCQYGEFFL